MSYCELGGLVGWVSGWVGGWVEWEETRSTYQEEVGGVGEGGWLESGWEEALVDEGEEERVGFFGGACWWVGGWRKKRWLD